MASYAALVLKFGLKTFGAIFIDTPKNTPSMKNTKSNAQSA